MIFPAEVKEAVKALANDIRLSIVEILQESGELAYTELLNCLDIQKGSLSHHLNILMEAGMIDNYARGDFRGQYSSYYRLSRFGKDVISGLLSSVEVSIIAKSTPRPRLETYETPARASPLNLAELYQQTAAVTADTPGNLSAVAVRAFISRHYKPITKKSKEYNALLDSELQHRRPSYPKVERQ